MKLHDQHLHSRHSFDCPTDPADNVRRAIELGLDGVTFTEHYDLHPEERGACIYNHNAYTEEIRRLLAEYGDRLFIGQGIEVGYFPGGEDEILAFLAPRRFDLVIISFHQLDNTPIHRPEAWADYDVNSGTRRYLEGVLEGVRFCLDLHRQGERIFDVLGHLDLVKRYTYRMFGAMVVDRYGELIDEILSTCLEAALVPEINTSTLRQGMGESMPGPDVVKRYAVLGGSAMSVGSDAHRAEAGGGDFDTAVGMLRDAGLSRIAVFRQRRRVDVPFE